MKTIHSKRDKEKKENKFSYDSTNMKAMAPRIHSVTVYTSWWSDDRLSFIHRENRGDKNEVSTIDECSSNTNTVKINAIFPSLPPVFRSGLRIAIPDRTQITSVL